MSAKEEKKQDAKLLTEQFLKLPEEKQMFVIGIIYGMQANVPQGTAQKASS